jgi:type I restriction enzyme M protein
MEDVKTHNYDLGVKNPNTPGEPALRSPIEIVEEMQSLDEETNNILLTIKELIG